MVYAIQIWLNGGWGTVGTCNTQDKAEVSRVNVANSHGTRARILECRTVADAWNQ